MRIIFFGSSEFSLPFLEWFQDKKEHSVVCAVTTPPAPKGRGLTLSPTCVETYARKAGLDIYSPASLKDKAVLEKLSGFKPEMFLVVSYGKILPAELLDLTPFPVNIHPSLLPRHRGPNPILSPLLEGDSQTGVTIMRMGPRLDTGEIYLQQTFALEPRITGGELEKRLITEGLKLLEEFFRRAASHSLQTIPQKETEATNSHKTKKEATCFSWGDPVVMIDRKVRAYHPKPRAFFEFRGRKIFVEEGEPVSFEGHSGEVQIDSLDREEGSIVLSLPQGAYSLKKVAPEGKSAMRAYDFLQGCRLKRGDLFR